MRSVLTILLLAATALLHAPARAADMSGGWGGAVHAGPFVVYDYEPGIVVRQYWLPPWAGRHYFPSGGKLPVVGRREVIPPAPVSDKRSFRREWTTFPIDTIQTPPLILNQQQYFPSGETTAPSVSK